MCVWLAMIAASVIRWLAQVQVRTLHAQLMSEGAWSYPSLLPPGLLQRLQRINGSHPGWVWSIGTMPV